LDDSLSKLEARVKAAAALAEKRTEFRRNSWYLPLDRNGERRRGPPEEPERPANAWDAILKAIEAAYRPDTPYLAVTRQICEAMKVRADPNLYGQATQGRLTRGMAKAKGSKKQRDDPETAWRKRLAKETVDLVVDQWKRVVLVGVTCALWIAQAHLYELFKYVRERWKAEEEEEERRRGQEHLDAILDQSKHILQSQHVSFSRAARKSVTEASTRSQSRLTQGYSDDSDEAEEGEGIGVGDSSGEDAEGHEEGTVALLNDSVPFSPPGTDADQERLTVRSRHTSADDIDQFPTTPSSPEAMDIENLVQLSDPVGDGITVDLRPPDPVKELAVSISSPAEFPPGSSELDYHEPDTGLVRPSRPSTPAVEDDVDDEVVVHDGGIEYYLRPYAVTKVDGWDPDQIIRPSPLLRGSLRPYQRAGLEWLANHHTQSFNCILADEMGKLSYPS
jgi:helicase SWR1